MNMKKERVHQIGRAIAWTCGESGGRESKRFQSIQDAEDSAQRLRSHIANGGWTGWYTMSCVAKSWEHDQ